MTQSNNKMITEQYIFFTTAEVAEILKIDRQSVLDMIHNNEIGFLKQGYRSYRIPKESLDKYISQKTTKI